ncbi:RNA polymerase II-associated protein 1 [Podospora australis]|uniref:RNA polymerase II-associated protein 1 n=1 Tax=Podospora australis TaxID=1536484 RepID=A0AAN6WRB9_9PEZI|nr:RNA polymerase II-associated protein 1 [Podospora australis]
MSSSQSRGVERAIHQDYIVRIRYSNALPPPPNPPKLLEIPNTGLASGQYTTPGFASRLAREQPLNIEADAELGMPLDLVGMPGVFDGDESSIQASAIAPPIHPNDRLLLRPLSTLGKPKSRDQAVSFLRRTEYISSVAARPKPSDSVFLKPSAQNKRPEKRKLASPEPDKGTPSWIKRRIEKSFEEAALMLADRSRVKHPSGKRGLKIIDAFPILPDLEAFPDSGAYVTVKFEKNPVNASGSYDTRLLSGIFKPIERTAAEEQAYEASKAAWDRDPLNVPRPSQMMNYDFYLPVDAKTGDRFRTKFDVDNPARDSKDLYTSSEAGGSFRFPRIRAYETVSEKEMDHNNKYDEQVILAFREDESQAKGRSNDSSQKAVYYYPVMQSTVINNQRTKNIARTIGITDDEEVHYDELLVKIDEPSDDLKAELDRYKQQPIGELLYDDEEEEEEEEGGNQGQARGRSDSPALRGGSPEEDQDAEGDEDDY